MSQPTSPLPKRDLRDSEWKLIEPLLPPPSKGRGRPRGDSRQIFNGIFWILRTGAPWRDLPQRYGRWQTVYHRFNAMNKDGTLGRIALALQIRLERTGKLDLTTLQIDSTVVRAHKSAAGAKKKRMKPTIKPWAAARADFPAKSTC